MAYFLSFEWSGLYGAVSVLCLLGYVAIMTFLWADRKSPTRPASWFAYLVWSIHGFCFYTSVIIAQLFFDYSPPSVFFTTWSSALRLHAIFAIGGIAFVRLRTSGKRNAP